ncbi:hypothetical protein ACHAXT_002962 [Thalassiosira profunda]
MAMQDDEFGDEIDWSAVQLPSVSAPGSAGNATNGPPPSTTGGPPLARHSWGGGAPAPSQHQSAAIPQQGHNTGSYGQNFAVAGAAAPVHNNFAPSNNDMDALRRQIASLQNQLQSKDDQIFELEATAAASAAESAHRTQRAESEAREKVRLAQEEARRAMAEADRNRGGMIRYKKKAAELEAEKQAKEGGQNPSHPGEGNLGAWGPPVADVEMRKVTPVTLEDDALPKGETLMRVRRNRAGRRSGRRGKPSGLVQVLLTKFHSLFHCVGDKNVVTVDGDGDHVMGGDDEENGENRNERSIEDGNQCYQRMALALLKTEEGESSCLPHKTLSWRAALRLLRVVHDILLLRQADAWDPVTMARPLNALFDILVGIMQGNAFDCSSDAAKDAASSTGREQTVVRSVQLKAIDVILALMSDAPPYDQAKDGGDGNRTPYLWNEGMKRDVQELLAEIAEDRKEG